MYIMFIYGGKYVGKQASSNCEDPKFDPTGVRTHDLQIMTVQFMSLRRLL